MYYVAEMMVRRILVDAFRKHPQPGNATGVGVRVEWPRVEGGDVAPHTYIATEVVQHPPNEGRLPAHAQPVQ